MAAAEDHAGRVWYAAYGSNLLAERFEVYLRGGSYGERGTIHQGARDATPARGWRLLEVDHQLRFARESRRWGGGVAFLDPDPGSGRAALRCWDLTVEQFADVAAQENGLSPGDIDVDLDAVVARGAVDLTDRWYGRALLLGALDDRPVVTFTCRQNASSNPPGRPYLSVVAGGLGEMGWPVEATVDYLRACPGVSEQWTRDQLVELVGVPPWT